MTNVTKGKKRNASTNSLEDAAIDIENIGIVHEDKYHSHGDGELENEVDLEQIDSGSEADSVDAAREPNVINDENLNVISPNIFILLLEFDTKVILTIF